MNGFGNALWWLHLCLLKKKKKKQKKKKFCFVFVYFSCEDYAVKFHKFFLFRKNNVKKKKNKLKINHNYNGKIYIA